jgi:NDP-4-keto-2,6-dideoxyhexose 3-C-methyltransferase
MIIKKCRSCNSTNLIFLFTLGNLAFTGKFPNKKQNIPKAKLTLVMCGKCKLVQLDRNFNQNYLYGKDYGYRTGINKTMTEHVKLVAKGAQKKMKLSSGEMVLDIASNDGTLLNSYSDRSIIKVGIDPLIYKYKKYYKKINYSFSNFFSEKIIPKKLKIKKFKIITALSMFYDLPRPNIFLNDIKKILHKDGIFILEHADLYSIYKNNVFDTICHEHLEYYSSTVIFEMLKKHKLEVFDHKFNNINGGSSQYHICHKNSKFKINKKKIKRIIDLEKKIKLSNVSTFKKFFKKIINTKKKLNSLIGKINKKNQIIHGYGASTKGNVLLQYLNIQNKTIEYIAERNPKKFNKFTPSTRIKIISEKESRKKNPNYYLVLPWHFKNEILVREKKIRAKGCKFIFPLPKLTIV